MRRLFAKYCNDSIRDNDDGEVWIGHQEENVCDKDDETLEEIA